MESMDLFRNSDTSANNELLSQFMEVTGCYDPDIVAHYFAMSNSDWNSAAVLFMEQNYEGASGVRVGERVPEQQTENHEDRRSQVTLNAPSTNICAPPFHLLFQGGFVDARAAATQCRRYLLVSIPRDENSAWQAFDRDIWRNQAVDQLVCDQFIFWHGVSSCFTERGLYSFLYCGSLAFIHFVHVARWIPHRK